MENVLLTQAEAANTLRIGRTTLWRLVKSGQLEQVNIGRRSLITRASIYKLVGVENV